MSSVVFDEEYSVATTPSSVADSVSAAREGASVDSYRFKDEDEIDKVTDQLKEIIQQIAVVCAEEEDEEAGIVRPAPKVLGRTISILVETAARMLQESSQYHACADFPVAHVTSDEEGGLRVEWIQNDRAVHLVMRTDKNKSYIYHQVGEAYDVEKRITAGRLFRWLRILD
jgi:hypothetical protein